ncbi:DUF4377 domain-containing protein [Polaribacter sp. L3A8]|uniref:DUF4377 domain-containing protein n=1 Tax=Polaribacter sp. L3A8 TaxID=2686361 RepID=UPI00131B48A4|nr:DUF4377 domain-containing protein [Polaribacter sp. L3A8]
MKLKTIMLAIFILMVSCEKKDLSLNKKILVIASEKVDCVGVSPQKCFLVREVDKQDWSFFYDSIIGFTYEAGFEYEILISEKQLENPPQDASSIEYKLIRIISKIEKTSENLTN